MSYVFYFYFRVHCTTRDSTRREKRERERDRFVFDIRVQPPPVLIKTDQYIFFHHTVFPFCVRVESHFLFQSTLYDEGLYTKREEILHSARVLLTESPENIWYTFIEYTFISRPTLKINYKNNLILI